MLADAIRRTPRRHRQGHGHRSAFAATLAAELRMRMRRRSSILQILLLAALTAVLVPPPTASYSIISARGLRPSLSADTALVTAAVVLNTVLFFVYSLIFDVGRHRDAANRTALLWHTSPAPAWIIGAGRLVANIGFGAGVVAVAGVLLGSTLYARYDAVPQFVAVALFMAICLPVVCLAAVTGLFVDLVLPPNAVLRAATVFAIWMSLVLSSVLGGVDALGMADLRWLIDDPSLTGSLSIGLISVSGQHVFVWQHLPDAALQRVPARIVDIGVVLAIGIAILLSASRRLHAVYASPVRLDASAQPPAVSTAQSPVLPHALEHRGHVPSRTARPRAIGLVLERLARRSPWGVAVLAAAMLTGLAGVAKPGFAIVIAAIVPFFLLGRTSGEEVRLGSELERCEAAFDGPGPALVVGMAVSAVLLAAVLPAVVRLGPAQAATALFGLVATAMWMTWTYRVVNLPILGVAVAGGTDYLLVFNDVPSHADILGLWHESATACGASAGMAAILTVVLYRSASPR